MIESEITESNLIDTDEDNKKLIRALRNAGFRISLDKFGTDYSNLSTLLDCDLTTLKLDKSFLEDMGDQVRWYVVGMIMSSKDYFSSDIVAERVEDKEIRNLLLELDCDTVPDYYYSKPLFLNVIEKFIKTF